MRSVDREREASRGAAKWATLDERATNARATRTAWIDTRFRVTTGERNETKDEGKSARRGRYLVF